MTSIVEGQSPAVRVDVSGPAPSDELPEGAGEIAWRIAVHSQELATRSQGNRRRKEGQRASEARH